MAATADPHRRFVQILRRTVAAPESDAALLARFVESRDEAAFAAIIERHGSLVLGVCRRMLGDCADAEDAFQAVFIALVRSGRRIRKGESLASWLYGAAYRVCQKARRSRSRIRTLERKATRGHSADPLAEISVRELLATLDDELARLTERLRLPLVLCLIEGLSQNEAAARLGCSPGSIKGRLERGREKLRRRLSARGVTLAAALSAAAVGSTNAAVPPDLFAQTAAVAAGKAVPMAVAKLAGAAVHSSASLARISAAILLAAAISIAAMGGGQQPEPKPAAEQPDKPAKATARVDRFGDPLPEGAIMRLGTVQFRVPEVVGVGFRPNGELVAISKLLTLHVWPPDGGPISRTMALRDQAFGSRVAISQDAHFVAAIVDKKLIVWDLSGEKPVEFLNRELDSSGICFSPDGKLLAVSGRSSSGRRAILFANLTTKSWRECPFAGQGIQSMSFRADGKELLILANQTISVIDTVATKELFSTTLPRRNYSFAALSPDGSTIAILPTGFVGLSRPTIKFLARGTAKEVSGLKSPAVSGWWLGYSPNGKTLIWGGPDGIVEWDPLAGNVVREFKGAAKSPPAYSADQRRFASHSYDALSVWDACTGDTLNSDPLNAGHANRVTSITVSRDSRLIATISLDGEIRVWSPESGKMLCQVRSSWNTDERIVFSPDSKSFIAVANDHVTPTVFDANTGRELKRFTVAPELAKSITRGLALSADGKTLTTVNHSGIPPCKVRWDVVTGTMVKSTALSNDELIFFDRNLVTYSSDGRWKLFTGNVSRPDGQESCQLIPKEETLDINCFGKDCRVVAITRMARNEKGFDNQHCGVAIYELASMARIVEVPGGLIYRIALSPDNRMLAIAGREELTLWDVASGKLLKRFLSKSAAPRTPSMPSRILAITFTPDGRKLVTGHDDCTALVWDMAQFVPNARTTVLSADELSRLWNSLADDDPAKAFAATFELSDHAKPTIEFLRKHLTPAKAANAELVRKLAASLDATGFAEREKAEKELRTLGDSAVAQLRNALKDNPSPEKKTRIERLLAEAAKFVLPPGDRLQQVRAVALLEHIGNKEAEGLLKELAGGLPDARLTREAAEALGRLDRTGHR